MGQYLAVAMATKMNAYIPKGVKNKLTPQDIIEGMGANIDIYDFEETNDYWNWTLKTSVLEAELLPFLEDIYTQLYDEDEEDDSEEDDDNEVQKDNSGCKYVLEKLRETPVDKWLQLANNEDCDDFYAFQSHYEGLNYDIMIPYKKTSIEISVSEEIIILALEGKIIMEMEGKCFHFFKQLFKTNINNI